MKTTELKVARIGNSRGVRLPAEVLRRYAIGDSVVMEERDEGLLLRPNAVGDLIRIMLGSDIVQFAVGTRINEAHQDPNIPVELDLRRNIVRRVAGLLESRYLKETSVRFF